MRGPVNLGVLFATSLLASDVAIGCSLSLINKNSSAGKNFSTTYVPTYIGWLVGHGKRERKREREKDRYPFRGRGPTLVEAERK
ncbi:uncharacterized protein F4817DRAFT_329914 [Daldinia loculata]|uniref:uncharacterized protein n=1 Tax=Daldinia loculata TaxID=103429 RepID=UPI0020C5452C|nr:uncharacterized protein F4817DRAFT_329914 [Daldinia loculata]KAI1649725.1 hypothetical protein F4817DRAFT_329914 [Daldinia loculata]